MGRLPAGVVRWFLIETDSGSGVAAGVSNYQEGYFRRVLSDIEAYAIFTLDPDGIVQTSNAGVEKLLGYSDAEFVGRHGSLIFTPEDCEEGVPDEELREAREQGKARDDRWHVRRDGSRVWVNGVMSSLRDDDGELLGFVKVMRDQTEEKRTQDALRDSEAKYRSLLEDVLDTSSMGVFILDSSLEVVWANRAVEQYFGLQRGEAIGRQAPELARERLAPTVDEPADFAERLYMEGPAEDPFEVHVRNESEGLEYWLEHRSQPIRSGPFQGGRTEQYYDITERKRSGKALVQARDELDSQVRERTANLVALNAELESFNYSVSHDLRAPLRGLTGFAQILLEDYREQLDERGSHYLERVSAAAERMGELIEALLALSRVSRSELVVDDLDLSQMALNIVNSLAERDPDRSVTLEVAPDVSARGDGTLMRIALENLLGNAWKFTADTADARIEFGVRDSAEGMIYFVRDNGAGFDMAYADKLFTPFQRLHSPKIFAGMGIGLATVQRIIHRHGGKVWGEGKEAGGATFSFSLPRHSNGNEDDRV